MEDVRKLKKALDMFSNATGLTINFHKSTVTPMNLPEGALQSFMDVLQCKESSFPEIYFSLPLSNVKLPLSAFAPLITKVDKYLASFAPEHSWSGCSHKLCLGWDPHLWYGGHAVAAWCGGRH
jgi:hypothetical protein